MADRILAISLSADRRERASVRAVPQNDCDVVVVGAGVTGLTTAVCLAEAGLRVTVVAAAPPAETTSSVAGAIWGPHLVEASARTERWRRETLAVLRELATDPATGVRIATGLQAARPGAPAGEPLDWLGDLGGVAPCSPADLPAGFATGWRYSAPLAHMPAYLGYLRARFGSAGGQVEAATVDSLPGAGRERGARAVVNCTGTGARHLVPDPEVTPFRGQVVVAANPGISEFFIGLPDSATDLVYLFPHRDTVVLGGTETAGDWNAEPIPAVAERILRDCAAVEPRLRGTRILAHRVGLRPFRPRVRLEAEPPGSAGPVAGPAHPRHPLVVHNYGHGGAGITLSWGCARAVTGLVSRGIRGSA
jgi:D-amino-acid oxidase